MALTAAPSHRKRLFECGEDALMGGIDFGGFEGLFGASLGEGPGDGFAVCGETFGRWGWEDVEDFSGDEEGLFWRGEEGGDFGVG